MISHCTACRTKECAIKNTSLCAITRGRAHRVTLLPEVHLQRSHQWPRRCRWAQRARRCNCHRRTPSALGRCRTCYLAARNVPRRPRPPLSPRHNLHPRHRPTTLAGGFLRSAQGSLARRRVSRIAPLSLERVRLGSGCMRRRRDVVAGLRWSCQAPWTRDVEDSPGGSWSTRQSVWVPPRRTGEGCAIRKTTQRGRRTVGLPHLKAVEFYRLQQNQSGIQYSHKY